MCDISTHLQKYEHLYPGIGLWWKRKVIPDVKSGIKRIQVIRLDNTIQGLAVFDREQAKLCHLSVIPEIRGLEYGKRLLKSVTLSYKFVWCTARQDIADDFVLWSGGKIEHLLTGDEVKIIIKVR